MLQAIPERDKDSGGIGPIRSPKDIERIRKMLHSKPRDLLLFDLAIQTGLRMNELLKLQVKDLLGLKPGDALVPGEGRGWKSNDPILTEPVLRTFRSYFDEVRPKPEDYVFKSRKGARPLTVSSVSHLVTSWFDAAGIEGLRGAKSLHKTWEYNVDHRSGRKANAVGGEESKVSVATLDTSTLQQRVYDALFQAIVCGRIRPGTRITAKEISKRLRVSAMPVREALSRLEATGFVATQKKKGTTVRGLSRKDLEEITTIRLTLETLAARKACAVRSERTLDRLESLMQAYLSAPDAEEFLRVNRQFHHTLYQDADMPMLLQLIVGLWDRISPYLHLYVHTIQDLGRERDPSAKCHEGMVDGMRRKDAAEVVKWLEADVQRCFQRTLQILESL